MGNAVQIHRNGVVTAVSRKYEIVDEDGDKTVPATKVAPPTLHPGGTGCAIGSSRSVGFVLAANDFITCDASSPMQAVQALVTRAAVECAGDAYYYSAPTGRGRKATPGSTHARAGSVLSLPSDDGVQPPPKSDQKPEFSVVCSSNVVALPGSKARPEHARVMYIAMYSGRHMAEQNEIAAACVRTNLGLEGILLVERPPRIKAVALHNSLPGLRLLSLTLAERLEKLQWEQEAREGRRSLGSLLTSLESIVKHNLDSAEHQSAQIVSPSRLQRQVKADHTTIWLWDSDKSEMVLNNSGRMDGMRVPASSSRLCRNVLQSRRCYVAQDGDGLADKRLLDRRIGRRDVENERVICVPIEEPKKRISTFRVRDKMARDKSITASAVTQRSQPSLLGQTLSHPLHPQWVGFDGPGLDMVYAPTSCSLESQEVRMMATATDATLHLIQGESEKEPGMSLVQFIKYGPVEFLEEYFDLAAAEHMTPNNSLSKAVWIRHHLMSFIASEKQSKASQTVSVALARCTKATDIIDTLEEVLPPAMQCAACSTWFIDDERSEVWAPPTDTVPYGMRVKMGEGLVGNVAVKARAKVSDEVQIVNDPASCPLWRGDRPGSNFVTRNIMTAPIWCGSGNQRHLVGLVQVLNKCALVGFHESAVFTAADAELLRTLASTIGGHLQRLALDIQWTKSCMDSLEESGLLDDDDDDQGPELISEYYTKDLTRHFHAAQTTMRRHSSSLRGAPPTQTSSRTVHNFLDSPLKSATVHFHMKPGEYEEVVLQSLFDAPSPVGVDCRDWHVHYWTLSEEDEFRLLLQALRHFDIFSDLCIERGHLYRFFQAVKACYRGVPFHNFYHALATVHYAFKLLDASGAGEHLLKTDIFALLLGALGHDCDHRGRNNAFEVVTRGELALRYNDSSPLENHHCAQAFQLALGPDPACGERNVFSKLSAEQFGNVRKRMIAGILSTDMKCHGHHVELIQNFELTPGAHSSQNQFLVELFLHTADISNPLMPKDMSYQWAQCIALEFTDQAAEEAALGVPVTAFMQGLQDQQTLFRSQVGFIDFVIYPLVGPMFRTFPGIAQAKTHLDENRQRYDSGAR
mmetsp:Transcript_49496/g.117804  ORF Transcript_49496/g.117804 Transcript_49496/m.117804 type:complete len:1089 (-) Transcript_49496:101-3367(-)